MPTVTSSPRSTALSVTVPADGDVTMQSRTFFFSKSTWAAAWSLFWMAASISSGRDPRFSFSYVC